MKIRMDKVIRTAVLIAVSVVTIIPILYTISASFKTNTEIILGGARLLPEEFTWENYGKAWSMARFDRYTWNSVRMSLVTTAGAVLFTSMSAYVFNRGRFPGRNLLYWLLLSTMFVSAGVITLFPILQLMSSIKLNNLFGVSLVQIFTAGAANLFLTIGYLKTINTEIDEAAIIDGCSFVRVYWNIILPLLKPILATVALLAFRRSWNDYLLPMVMTFGKSANYPLVVGVVQLKSSGGEMASQYNLMMAGTMFSILPIILIYMSMNRYFISGMTAGALKG